MPSKLPEHSWVKESSLPCGFHGTALRANFVRASNLFPMPDDPSYTTCILRPEAEAYNLCQIIYDLLGELPNKEKKRKHLEEEYSFVYWIAYHISSHVQRSLLEQHESLNKKTTEINVRIWEICELNTSAMARVIMAKHFFDTGVVFKKFSEASRQDLRKKIRKISCLFRYMRKTNDTYIFLESVSVDTLPAVHLMDIRRCLVSLIIHLQNLIKWNSITTTAKVRVLCKSFFDKINFLIIEFIEFIQNFEIYNFKIKGFINCSFGVRRKKEKFKIRKFAIFQ